MKKEILFFTDNSEIGTPNVPVKNKQFKDGGVENGDYQKVELELSNNSKSNYVPAVKIKALFDYDNEKIKFVGLDTFDNFRMRWIKVQENKSGYFITAKYFGGVVYIDNYLKILSDYKKQTNPKMAEGGLIAPNGERSYLTPEQYKLVRTPEFKAWFGDWENDPKNASKVVDSNGEPLVMYHGTDTEFTEFKHQKKGWDTFWFTPRMDTAQMYSNTEKNNPVVFECFLNLRNPHNKYPFDTVKYDGFIDYRVEVDYFTFKKINTIEVVQVVNSNQIKLADGTNTTFDGSNPDIRYKDGGSIDNERIVCQKCDWSWKVVDGGDDLYVCHKCGYDNAPFYESKLNYFKTGGNMENKTPKVKLAVKNKIKQLAKRIQEIYNLNLGDEDDFSSYKGDLSIRERRKLFEENKKLEAQLTQITDTLSQEQCFSIEDENFQGLNAGGDYGYEDEEMFAGGGGIDINEPFKVNGKTLAERVRILVKQLYPDYKWSITSSYSKMDVYLLEADFDPFTDLFQQENPDRKYYSVDDRDLSDYNRQNNAKITERAVEVFKPIRDYINKFIVNYNANDPYADYSSYNVYEYTYIGKWDKPYKQVEPKSGKKAKAKTPVTPTVASTPAIVEPKFKIGDIVFYRSTGDKKYKVIEFIEFDSEIQENIYRIESLSDKTKGKAKEILMSLVETKPKFKVGDIITYSNTEDKKYKIIEFIEFSNEIQDNIYKIESLSEKWGSRTLAKESMMSLVESAVPTAEQNTFLDYLKANNEKATLIPRELEVMNALTLFIQSAKEIENLDADRYATLLVNMIEKLTPTT